jgi:5-methylcytosine-specific restriction endonuclease McrBC regulatory subunit McrC
MLTIKRKPSINGSDTLYHLNKRSSYHRYVGVSRQYIYSEFVEYYRGGKQFDSYRHFMRHGLFVVSKKLC